MTDNKGITRVAGTASSFLSKYAGGQEDTSLQSMASLVMLPRMKIIQGQTETALKQQFGEGSVIIRPGDALVWKHGDGAFQFVPLHFHREWMTWNHQNDPAGYIKDGPEFDEKGPIAKKAADKNKREEPYPDNVGKPARDHRYYTSVEHLCWTGVIYGDHPLAGTEVVLGMERGEYYNGRNLINAMTMRKETIPGKNEGDPEQRVPVPLWAQVWALQPAVRPGDKGSWYGLDFKPADNPVIDENDSEAFSARHAELARLFAAKKLRIQHDDAGSNQGTTVVDDGKPDGN